MPWRLTDIIVLLFMIITLCTKLIYRLLFIRLEQHLVKIQLIKIYDNELKVEQITTFWLSFLYLQQNFVNKINRKCWYIVLMTQLLRDDWHDFPKACFTVSAACVACTSIDGVLDAHVKELDSEDFPVNHQLVKTEKVYRLQSLFRSIKIYIGITCTRISKA